MVVFKLFFCLQKLFLSLSARSLSLTPTLLLQDHCLRGEGRGGGEGERMGGREERIGREEERKNGKGEVCLTYSHCCHTPPSD